MKKILLTILLVAILAVAFSLPTVTAAAEENDLAIQLDKSFSGRTLTMTGRIMQNDGFVTLFLTLDFDKDAFEIKSVTFGSYFDREFLTESTLDSIKSGKADKLVMGFFGEGSNCTETGELFTAVFEVKEGAVNGKHPFDLGIAEVGYYKTGSSDIVYNKKYGNGVDLSAMKDGILPDGVSIVKEEVLITDGAPAPDEAGSRTLVIVLCTVGGIIVVAGLILAAYFIYKKKQVNPTEPTQKKSENENGKN